MEITTQDAIMVFDDQEYEAKEAFLYLQEIYSVSHPNIFHEILQHVRINENIDAYDVSWILRFIGRACKYSFLEKCADVISSESYDEYVKNILGQKKNELLRFEKPQYVHQASALAASSSPTKHTEVPNNPNSSFNRIINMLKKESQLSTNNTNIANSARSNNGENVYHIAAKDLNISLLSNIIKANIDKKLINQIDNDGNTPLLAALKTKSTNSKNDVVTQLLKANGDPNIQDKDGNTILHLAAMNKDAALYTIITTLCDNADDSLRNNAGQTPMEIYPLLKPKKISGFISLSSADSTI
ncbi:hypothetical protein TVAG_462560 [Trichomonas vaginalis G3]|uniref:Uncharacterized protein n=1 Tax=Trichomonas vaginalis (strain ATCC PRA-98 / G3) TaxID=412133 RepID=A2DLW7_TRIV3|nr:histone-lysine N-methyltransferase family [Trichomonas vaginalis G3]EAY18570.1 hypothetical protein TVAG_462560 [Trichomonas vaginalis G3]KAI5491597.1 histone-lysine N-methyltransferase family [Trichomonas vaginalis G3]|eukprot:XP_001579556.1 hypothetical protein [Trichomonas vaginalis G3]